MPRRPPLTTALTSLRDYARSFPLGTEDHPWGETAMKVKGKVFVFLSLHDGSLNVTFKLPVSGRTALGLPFAQPTGYGLGKHGWVTATFAPGDSVPLDLLREWIEESYRAVAPRSALAQLEQAESPKKSSPRRPTNASNRLR